MNKKKYIWPILCGLLVSILAIIIFPVGKPFSFYKLLNECGINWKLAGVWIDLLLSISMTYIIASILAILLAALTSRSLAHLANIVGFAAAITHLIVTGIAQLRSDINWQLFNSIYFGALHLFELIAIFYIVFYAVRFGCYIAKYLTATFKRDA